MSYVFLQCRNEQCRLRFPASATEAKTLHCPRCRSGVTVVVEAISDKPATGNSPLDGLNLIAILDNIRSIHNVGSMFRSADGAGVRHLHLAGITATPKHPKLAKAALGAQESVGWTYHPNGVEAAAGLRAEGYRLWALERLTSSGNPPLEASKVPGGGLALIVGNERAGVDPGILAQCDAIYSLPMVGRKSSLNAAVAFGIAVYYLRFGTMILTHE